MSAINCRLQKTISVAKCQLAKLGITLVAACLSWELAVCAKVWLKCCYNRLPISWRWRRTVLIYSAGARRCSPHVVSQTRVSVAFCRRPSWTDSVSAPMSCNYSQQLATRCTAALDEPFNKLLFNRKRVVATENTHCNRCTIKAVGLSGFFLVDKEYKWFLPTA